MHVLRNFRVFRPCVGVSCNNCLTVRIRDCRTVSWRRRLTSRCVACSCAPPWSRRTAEQHTWRFAHLIVQRSGLRQTLKCDAHALHVRHFSSPSGAMHRRQAIHSSLHAVHGLNVSCFAASRTTHFESVSLFYVKCLSTGSQPFAIRQGVWLKRRIISKSVLSLVPRRLVYADATRFCCRARLAGVPAIDRILQQTPTSAANLLVAAVVVDQWDRQTDRQTDRQKDGHPTVT